VEASPCWRIWARVLRFQIATAIPPRAAEVASNRLVRQKLRCSGEGSSPEAGLLGTESVLSIFGLGKLRNGMKNPEKPGKAWCGATNFLTSRLWVHEQDEGLQNTGISIKKREKCVFLRNLVFAGGSSANMSSVAVEALALAARF
jgi:hypothetical protein